MKKLYYAFFLLFFGISVNAQNANQPCPCCTPNHAKFDFWEGDWVVTDTVGNQVGTNKLIKMQNNCVMQENWVGASGGTGTSYNFYNRADSTWNQLWVSNTGGVLELKGDGGDGKMVLRSKLIKAQQQNIFYYNQITWTKNEDGTVTQLWELYDKNDKLLRTSFKGIYRKKEE